MFQDPGREWIQVLSREQYRSLAEGQDAQQGLPASYLDGPSYLRAKAAAPCQAARPVASLRGAKVELDQDESPVAWGSYRVERQCPELEVEQQDCRSWVSTPDPTS